MPRGFQKGNKLTYLKKSFKHTPETKLKMSMLKKGKTSNRKGVKLSEETRRKISETLKSKELKGEKNSNWKGGISKYEKPYSALRRKRMVEAPGSHTSYEWERLKIQYGFACPCCKKKEPEIKLTKDHVIPLSKGGSHYIENIQPLCKYCNSKKHNKIISKYLI